MIIDLPNTTTSHISRSLVTLREEGGAVALGRVLTLVIPIYVGNGEAEIAAANDASREHPMRVIVLVATADPEAKPRLDAQIRVGGDAGASEVIVLRASGEAASDEQSLVTGLLLPDAPVVVWWPKVVPEIPSMSSLGRIAQRRITDAAAQPSPHDALLHLAQSYAPGDTDFSWTRLTLWRAQLAAVLDQPPYEPILDVVVSGAADSPSTILLAAWLRLQLRVPVELIKLPASEHTAGIHGVTLRRASGNVELERAVPGVGTLRLPGQPVQGLSLPRRGLRDCLAEELRRLDPDDLYGEVITRGIEMLEHPDDVTPIPPQAEGVGQQ
ncbi:glucose-6-phosphate dehydrogenase assembly protein OpcA [Homoserinimonas sp. OAct 916]|uniref:glucose-6-phosphate dehydrogenase assembly protein OpcA n=1 Tax=Homoserinimonas sp. OAct 916 TaxID=2211450 RepID=UPI000DBE86E0|nr:glucose-6-phosphate dehydrogenase assembly protein OpcA [Homoserinimonas sp. OAct 916]